MFINDYPLFIPKKILKIDMLENLRDYPRDMIRIFYQNYSDGIITGCDIKINEMELILKPGIIKFGGVIYMLNEEVKMTYKPTNSLVYFKIRFEKEKKEKNKIINETELVIEEEELAENEMELCRFRLQNGARLRDKYINLGDFNTKYDTINRLYVPYAAEGKSTIWIDFLRYFAREIIKKQAETLDVTFAMHILGSSGYVNREYIESYINQRLGHYGNEYTNKEIYENLALISDMVKQGERIAKGAIKKERKVLLV